MHYLLDLSHNIERACLFEQTGLQGLTNALVTVHRFWYEEDAVLAESFVRHSDTQVRFYRQSAP